MLVEPGIILTNDKAYQKFTPYYNKWLKIKKEIPEKQIIKNNLGIFSKQIKYSKNINFLYSLYDQNNYSNLYLKFIFTSSEEK